MEKMQTQTEQRPEDQTDEERRLISKLNNIIDMCFRGSAKHFIRRKRFKDRYYAYDEQLERRKSDWQSKFVHNFAHTAVELKSSFYTQALVGNGSKPFFVAQPWDVSESRKAEIITKKLQYDFSRSKISTNIYTLMKDASIYGDGVIKTFWNRNKIAVSQKPLIKTNFRNGQFEYIAIPQEPKLVVKKDQPDAITVNINDFWPDPSPSAKTIDDCRFICHRALSSFEELKKLEKEGVYRNIDMVQRTNIPRRAIEEESLRVKEIINEDLDVEIGLQNNSINSRVVEIIEVWMQNGQVFTLANGSVLIDSQPGKSKYEHLSYPFVKISNEPMTNEFWGTSDFEVAEKLLTQIDSLQNLITDNLHFGLKRFALVERGIGATAQKELDKIEPGSKIVVNDLNAIRFEQPPPFDQSATFGMNQLLGQAQQSLSVTDILQGVAPPSNIRTTGGLEALAQIGQNRLVVSTMLFGEQLAEMGKQWVALNQQFMDRSVNFSLAGPFGAEFVEIRPEDIPLGIDVQVKLGSIAQGNKELKLQQMLQSFNMFNQIPGFNAVRAAKEIMLTQGEFDDPSRLFLLTEQDAAQLQTQNFLAAIGKNADGSAQTPPQDPAMTGSLQVPDPNQVAQGNANAGVASVPGI